MKGAVLVLKLLRGRQGSEVNTQESSGSPVCGFVNVQLCGGGVGGKPLQGTVLLENPRGTTAMNLNQLRRQVTASTSCSQSYCV